MDIRTKIKIGVAVIGAAILFICGAQCHRIRKLTSERDKYRNNSVELLGDMQQYRVHDSLNAARVQSMELTIKEFQRFRADDAQLIRELFARNRDLAAVNKTQLQTIIDLKAMPRDTTIIRDTVPIPAVAVHCGDAWFDFDGLLTEKEFTGTLTNRDSLLVAESVRYKRFLGFLWKTKKIHDRRIDVVNKNPHTTILGVEHVVIER